MLAISRTRTVFVFSAAVMLFFTSATYASTILDVSLEPITVTPGQTGVTVFGNLTNQSGDIVFLNADSENLPSNIAVPLSISDAPFFANAPLSLDNGASTGLIALFTFDVSPAAPYGFSNAGTFEVLGGQGAANQANFDVLASQNVNVTVAPEAANTSNVFIGLALLGISAGIQARLRRRRDHARQERLVEADHL